MSCTATTFSDETHYQSQEYNPRTRLSEHLKKSDSGSLPGSQFQPSQTGEREGQSLNGFWSESTTRWPYVIMDPQVPKYGLRKFHESLQENQKVEMEQAECSPERDCVRPSLQPVAQCENKFCRQKEVITSSEEIGRRLCKCCLDSYVKGSFCQFCEQIYSQTSQKYDNEEWIACDLCQRWNHTSCEARCRDPEILHKREAAYHCLKCSRTKVSKRISKPTQDENYLYEDVIKKKRLTERSKFLQDLQPIPIFNHGKARQDNFIYLDSFLSSCGLKTSLSEQRLKQDLQYFYDFLFKHHEKRTRPHLEEQNKKRRAKESQTDRRKPKQ